MAITRTIYTNSDVELQGESNLLVGSSGGGNALYAQPNTVQNATFTLTIPRADVNSFGFKGVIGRPQIEASSATIEFSWIPLIGPSDAPADPDTLEDPIGGNVGGAPPAANVLTELDLNDLMADTLENSPYYVSVNAHNVGQIHHALMTSLSGDATVGALPTFTASFLGAQPADLAGTTVDWTEDAGDTAGTGAGLSTLQTAGQNVATAGVNVSICEPKDISVLGGVNDDQAQGCVQSGSFTWDMPVELVLCLGGDPASDGEALSSPPGTASITVEGLNEVAEANKVSKLKIGAYRFKLGPHAEIDSRTHNMAVGELFGTYNYVVGSTGDSCSMD